MGITLGWGPCLSFCSPILLPYIAATQTSWLKGLRAAIIFSLSRILAYMVLALIVVSIGRVIINKFYGHTIGISIYLLIGIFISLLGLVLFFGKKFESLQLCKILNIHTSGRGLKSLIILGILIGLAPCIPLFGALSYIAFVSKNLLEGIFLGFCFGIGTLLSPLVIFGLLAGGLPKTLFKNHKIFTIFNRICGLFLFYLGLKLIIKVL
jgi:sulfite exporter TauE/SafE